MKLNQVFPNWMNDGIFTYLNDYDVPWKDEEISSLLNYEYHGNHSGRKEVSPLIDNLLEMGSLSSTAKENIASIIYGMFGLNWLKLWETLKLEYNPLENYNGTETETIETAKNDTHTGSGSDTNSRTGSDGITTSGTAETKNSTHGFNSVTAVDTDKQNGTTSGSTTTNYGSVDSRTLSDSSTDVGTENVTRTLHKSGNLGLTTSQQMISSQRELWQWNFYNVIFSDIDTVLTTGVY